MAAVLVNSWEELCCALKENNLTALKDLTCKSSNQWLTDYNPIVKFWYFDYLKTVKLQKVKEEFWKYYCWQQQDSSGLTNWKRLIDSFDYLYRQLQSNTISIDFLRDVDPVKDSDLYNEYYQVSWSVVFNHFPKLFVKSLESFYSTALIAFLHASSDDNSQKEDDSTPDELIELLDHGYSLEEVLGEFKKFNLQVIEMQLVKPVCTSCFTEVLYNQISKYVNDTCIEKYNIYSLPQCENWISTMLMEWLRTILGDHDAVTSWKTHIMHNLYKIYGELRISELFDIIIEFPESIPSLEELKICMERNKLRTTVAYSLRDTFQNRLLHPGANTNDILNQYISAIYSLRVIDPSGVILDVACYPIRKYLSTREDTIKSIISNLTGDIEGDLAQQLTRGIDMTDKDSANDSVTDSDEDWMPDPIDAIARSAITSGRHKKKDIISMLVTIYGSKVLFCSEYRSMLAQRLLSTYDFKIEKEHRYLELLKLRFGEANLSPCDVMLKDVKDSSRINSYIKSKQSNQKDENGNDLIMDYDLNALIISEVFWPKLKEDNKLRLPKELEKTMTTFTKHYEKIKAMRTLHWQPHLGLVELNIELANRTRQYSVPPIQAAIIYLFQDKLQWTIEELSDELQVSGTMLRRKMSFWIGQGLLKEEPNDTYHLVEDEKSYDLFDTVTILTHKDSPEGEISDEENVSGVTTAVDQLQEEQQLYWSYIVGMLTNFSSMTLDRISNSLKLFAPNASDLSNQDLKAFLDQKVQEQKLVLLGDEYALLK